MPLVLYCYCFVLFLIPITDCPSATSDPTAKIASLFFFSQPPTPQTGAAQLNSSARHTWLFIICHHKMSANDKSNRFLSCFLPARTLQRLGQQVVHTCTNVRNSPASCWPPAGCRMSTLHSFPGKVPNCIYSRVPSLVLLMYQWK